MFYSDVSGPESPSKKTGSQSSLDKLDQELNVCVSHTRSGQGSIRVVSAMIRYISRSPRFHFVVAGAAERAAAARRVVVTGVDLHQHPGHH